ncbi:MAG: GDYXXLXY domain-containing protein [Chitinophagaceae bacterium]
MKKIVLLIFVLMVLAQWFVPARMIWNREEVLQKGKAFRFQTQPVDPEDPFRGRYVQLSFRADTAYAKDFQGGENAYAEIETDNAGYARIKQLHRNAPASVDYVEVKVYYRIFNNEKEVGEGRVLVEYPFQQFFLDEYKAPEAENLYASFARDSAQKTYALVNIYKGKGVIKDLFINDKSIYSYFK